MKLPYKIIKEFKEFYLHLSKFLGKIKHDHISAFSAQAAFFIMLSFFAFFIIIMSLARYFPFDQSDLVSFILSIMPLELQKYLYIVVNDISQKTNGAVISISVITALWSSSKGILSVSNCFNLVYEIEETRNYFFLRFLCMIYTLVLALILIITLTLFVFGNQLYELISYYFPVLNDILNRIIYFRSIVGVFMYFIFFCALYKILPNKKIMFKYVLTGAAFSTAGWLLLSFLFSI
jgi:membrane protein